MQATDPLRAPSPASPGRGGAAGRAAQAARTLADPRWAAVIARDPDADGRFWYAVSSTGVYCRPSCAARTPRPEHVTFHDSRASAERAGYRPCRRCRPEAPPLAQRQAAMVAALCRHIEHAERPPALAELAARAGLSPHHLHRVFRRVTGLTPRQFADALRDARVRTALARGEPVTQALYDAGFQSAGRFYERADRALGMTPGDYRAGGAGQEIRYATGGCSLGVILVAQSLRGICAILLGDDAAALVHELEGRFPRARLVAAGAGFAAVLDAAIRLVEEPGAGLGLPLDLRGTAFQQRVWQALQRIPAGSTTTYTEVAQQLGMPRAVRAVAHACASNAVAVAVPCHRVLRRDGSLAGYRWGLARKRALLEREADTPPTGEMP